MPSVEEGCLIVVAESNVLDDPLFISDAFRHFQDSVLRKAPAKSFGFVCAGVDTDVASDAAGGSKRIIVYSLNGSISE